MSTRRFGLYAAVAVFAIALSSGALAVTPLGPGFNYQGKLNQGGTPYDGTADFQFALFDASSGNGQIGSPQDKLAIDVTAGLFTAENINFGAVFDGNERWLEIRVHTPSNNGVGPYTTLSPRQLLRAVPYVSYALSSASAASSGNATQLNGQPASYYTNAANLTGTLPGSALSGTYSGALSLTNGANIFAGNGAFLTNLSATNITSGTLNPAQLPNGGVAGGDLTGSYPNPLIADGAVTDAKIASVSWSKITGVPEGLNPPLWTPVPNQNSPLVGWGWNGEGETNVPSGTFTAVAGGFSHSLAIRTDGTLVGWGDNTSGQINVPTGTFVAVAAGGDHSLAIRSDGTLAGWGSNNSGQSNVPSGTFIAVSAGYSHGLAIRTDGTLVGWGANNEGQINVPSGTFVAVSAGWDFGVAIRTNGTLVAWGFNLNGLTNPPSGTFAVVAGGWGHAVAIRTDGTLAGWGWNQDGQTNVPSGTFTAVAAGHFHSLAIRTDGTLASWGGSDYGALDVPSGTFGAIASGSDHGLAIGTILGQYYLGGNVGIGTNAPTNSLSVVGNADFTGGVTANTANFSGNVAANTANFAGNVTSNGLATGNVAANTANFAGNVASNSLNTGNIAATTGSFTGNVGIGTSTPSSKLSVVGTGDFTGGLVVDSAGANNGNVTSNALRFGGTSGGIGEGIASKRTGGGNQWGLDFYTASQNRLSITNGGNVGIGTSSPVAKLHVVNGSAGLAPNGNVSLVLERNAANYLNVLAPDNSETGVLFGKPTLGGAGGGMIFNNPATPDGLQFRTNGNQTRMVIDASGNVGVGTMAPASPLHIVGSLTNLPMARVVNNLDSQVSIALDTTFRQWRIGQNRPDGNILDAFYIMDLSAGQSRLLIDTSGQCGIGTAAPNATLSVGGTANKPGGGSWGIFSDIRLKKNINDLTGSLDSLMALRGVTYEYIDPCDINETPGTHIGMIAQEVEQVFPQWVTETSNGYKMLSFSGFEALTVEALRDLRNEKDAQIADLKAENAVLKERLDALETLIRSMAHKEQ